MEIEPIDYIIKSKCYEMTKGELIKEIMKLVEDNNILSKIS